MPPVGCGARHIVGAGRGGIRQDALPGFGALWNRVPEAIFAALILMIAGDRGYADTGRDYVLVLFFGLIF